MSVSLVCFLFILLLFWLHSLVPFVNVDCCDYHLLRARKAEERQKKQAELRRLKNLKREEIRKRLQAIQEMSGGALVNDCGGGAEGTGEDAQALIEGDFDAQQ